MITLVRTLVQSRLYYGLEAFYDLPPSLVTAIERVECRAIKLALGLPRSTPRYLAYREAGLLPTSQHVKLICAKYIFRAQTVANSTREEVLGAFGGPARVRFCVPLRDFALDLIQAAGVGENGVAGRPLHPYPPWVVERARIELGMAGLRKSENPLHINLVAREYIITNYEKFLKIYTDGSLLASGVGSAFVIPEWGYVTRLFLLQS